MDRDEMPPRWMWPFDDELEVHWANVDQRRKERFGNNSDDDSGGGGKGMVRNELVKPRRR